MKNKKGFIGGIAIGVLTSIVFALSLFIVPSVFGNDISINSKLQYIQKVLDKYYVEDVNYDELEEGIYKGFVASIGDPYTNYFTKEEFGDFKEAASGKYAGIGIMMQVDQKDKLITAIQVFKGSPAEKAGLLPQDKLISADGIELNSDNFEDASKIIRGEVGTKVTIEIFRPSENKTIEFEIKRDRVESPTVDHRKLEDNIGYIEIKEFEEVTYDQFKIALDDLQSKDVDGIIIDVRNNLGGLLNIVAKISDELLDKGMIVYTKDKNDKIQKLESTAKHTEIPVTLLINENSASASEILAGALKDRGRAKLVGTKTYGKGVVQTILPLPDGSGVKVTTSKYYTPNDISIDGVGIEPDYQVDLPAELIFKANLEDDEDPQLQKALEILKLEIK